MKEDCEEAGKWRFELERTLKGFFSARCRAYSTFFFLLRRPTGRDRGGHLGGVPAGRHLLPRLGADLQLAQALGDPDRAAEDGGNVAHGQAVDAGMGRDDVLPSKR